MYDFFFSFKHKFEKNLFFRQKNNRIGFGGHLGGFYYELSKKMFKSLKLFPNTSETGYSIIL